MESIPRFLNREDGPTAVEYAVMMILTMCIVAIQVISDSLFSGMTNSADEIENYVT